MSFSILQQSLKKNNVMPQNYNDHKMIMSKFKMVQNKEVGIAFYSNGSFGNDKLRSTSGKKFAPGNFVVGDLEEGIYYDVQVPLKDDVQYDLMSFDVGNGYCSAFYSSGSEDILVVFSYVLHEVRVIDFTGYNFALAGSFDEGDLLVGVSKSKLKIVSNIFQSNETVEEIDLVDALALIPNVKSSKVVSPYEILLVEGVQKWTLVNLENGATILKSPKKSEYIVLIDVNDQYVAVSGPNMLMMTSRETGTSISFEMDYSPFCMSLKGNKIIVGDTSGNLTVFLDSGERYHLRETQYKPESIQDTRMRSKVSFKENYVIFQCDKQISIFHPKIPNSELKKFNTGKKDLWKSFLLIHNTNSMKVDLLYSHKDKILKKNYSVSKQSLISRKKKCLKSSQYSIIKDSPTISPVIIKYILQDDDFLTEFTKSASDLVTSLNVVRSIIRIIHETNQLGPFFKRLIDTEIAYMPELFDIKMERNIGANDALKFRFYPEKESSLEVIDVAFVEIRYFTRTLNGAFSICGATYFNDYIFDSVKEIMKEKDILEVDSRLLEIHLKKNNVEYNEESLSLLISENANKLKSYCFQILDNLENSLESFPPLMKSTLNYLHDKLTDAFSNRGRITRLTRGANKLLFWLWLSNLVMNPPKSTRRTSVQQRNLSLVANMIEMECRGEGNSIEIISNWDTEARMNRISYTLCKSEADDFTDNAIQAKIEDYVNVAEYLKSVCSVMLNGLAKETEIYSILSKISVDKSLDVFTDQQKKFADEASPELDGFGPACYAVQAKGGVDYFQNPIPANISLPITPVRYDSFLATNPQQFDNYSDWFNEEIKNHEFTIIVIYRGKVCGWCYSYMTAWNKYFTKILGRDGMLVGYSLESQKVANMVIDEWNLDYPQLGEPGNNLGAQYNVKLSNLPGFEYGLAQPAIIVKSKTGEMIYHWTQLPGLTNNGGSVNRPRPSDVIDAIDYFFYIEGETSVSSSSPSSE